VALTLASTMLQVVTQRNERPSTVADDPNG
jgi:hypothetical protein